MHSRTGDEDKLIDKLRNMHEGGMTTGGLSTLAAAMANDVDYGALEDTQALYDHHLEKTGDEDKLLDKLRNR